ncbi:MAG: PD-(D/E)XK nuclease domain-containing protein [Lachnospiraceae bacterium]|nr:PD-(D/E)XK nuclease domain-containing protein [Lachnospiraceae bacterium]
MICSIVQSPRLNCNETFHFVCLILLRQLKYAENAAFENACQDAIKQLKDRHYEEALLDDGMKTIYRYGIACYKKRCKVISV